MKNYKNKIINDRWILKRKISSGSFGVVYLGKDLHNGENVAVKLELPENEEVQSFDREIEILKEIQNVPGVPKLYYSEMNKNSENIMIIELLGRDLAYFQKHYKSLSIQTISYISYQMIEILERIHSQSVIHRDLKPENILSSYDTSDN